MNTYSYVDKSGKNATVSAASADAALKAVGSLADPHSGVQLEPAPPLPGPSKQSATPSGSTGTQGTTIPTKGNANAPATLTGPVTYAGGSSAGTSTTGGTNNSTGTTGSSTSPYYFRSTGGSSNPDSSFSSATANLAPNAPLTEEQLFEKYYNQSGAVLDAINKSEAAAESAANIASTKRTSAQNFSLNSVGLAGSSEADAMANANETERGQAINEAKAAQATAIGEVVKNVQKLAIDQANVEKTDAENLSANYIKERTTQAQGVVKALAASGVTPDQLSQSNPQEYNTLLQYYNGDSSALNADYLASVPAPSILNNGQPVATHGNQAVFMVIDPVTKQPKTITVDSPIPFAGSYKAIQTPYGVVVYDANTGESKMINGGTGSGTGPEAIAQGVADGTIPPSVISGNSNQKFAILAQLQNMGVDLSTLTSEWNATQTFIKSANSTQQLRLRQAATSVQSSLANLKELNNEFQRYGITWANKADLAVLSQGVGEQAQLAAQFLTQLNLVTDELGQVFMGGNSPTDKALGLASGVLRSDFTADQLNSVIGTLDNNITFRLNALSDTGPTATGGANPYDITGNTSGTGTTNTASGYGW